MQPNNNPLQRESQQSTGIMQKVCIQNKLVGVLHETGSPQVVVLCHGNVSSKDYYIMVNLACALEYQGITAFRFDFSGNGESEGSIRADSFFINVEDLRSVVEYLTGVNRLVVAILGHSRGANLVLLYASKYHDIPAVIQVSACCDFERVIERPTEVDDQAAEESMMEQFTPNMREACLSIDERCRVLTVHGSADEMIPVEVASEFAKIIPNHRVQIVEGANHGYSSHQYELAQVVLAFVKECMQHGEDVSN